MLVFMCFYGFLCLCVFIGGKMSELYLFLGVILRVITFNDMFRF